jgi:drug/metabolite transporter (DMT)-like permease
MLKSMSGRDSTDALVGWNLILTVPLAALPALWFWTTPTWPQLGLLAIQGALGALNMTAITRSLALAPASFVAPFEFLRLPFVAILAFAFFGEVAGLGTWVGATIIFGSTLLLIGPIGLRNAAGRA